MTGVVDFRTQLLGELGASIGTENPLPVTDSGGSALASYALNDFADGTPMYLGKAKPGGTWLVQQYDSSTGAMRYANESNNPGVTTYSTAWSGRAGLTYGLYQELSGT